MALDEYAIRVYTFVEHALREDAQDKLWLAQAGRLAQADSKDFESFVDSMDRFTHDILEEETVSPSELKNVLD